LEHAVVNTHSIPAFGGNAALLHRQGPFILCVNVRPNHEEFVFKFPSVRGKQNKWQCDTSVISCHVDEAPGGADRHTFRWLYLQQ